MKSNYGRHSLVSPLEIHGHCSQPLNQPPSVGISSDNAGLLQGRMIQRRDLTLPLGSSEAHKAKLGTMWELIYSICILTFPSRRGRCSRQLITS